MGKEGGGEIGSKTDAGSTPKKHPLPGGEHEVPPYAFSRAAAPESLGHPFWHPAPRDLSEAPVHFHKNAVSLELHLGDPRQRLAGMTDAERAWRKKFVTDQYLAAEEPVYVPELYANFNPLRRIYRFPWDVLERRVLIPTMGYTYGHYTRTIVPKLFLGTIGVMWMYYNVKYHHASWFDRHRMSVITPETPLVREQEIREKEPGLMEKGFKQYKTKQDYHNLDFKNRYTHLNLDPPLRP